MLAADLHQHLWPDPLLSALARRTSPPRLHRRRDGWRLELPGEAASELRLVDHDPVSRAWAAWGRAAHPRLRVVFARLAGGAPLHAERLAARGGPAAAVHDDLTYFDVSSYGPRTVDAMLRVVGVDRLVLGTDRPVIEPPSLAELGPSFLHSVRVANPARVLTAAPLAEAA